MGFFPDTMKHDEERNAVRNMTWCHTIRVYDALRQETRRDIQYGLRNTPCGTAQVRFRSIRDQEVTKNTLHPMVYLAANHLWTSKDLLAAAEVPRPTSCHPHMTHRATDSTFLRSTTFLHRTSRKQNFVSLLETHLMSFSLIVLIVIRDAAACWSAPPPPSRTTVPLNTCLCSRAALHWSHPLCNTTV